MTKEVFIIILMASALIYFVLGTIAIIDTIKSRRIIFVFIVGLFAFIFFMLSSMLMMEQMEKKKLPVQSLEYGLYIEPGVRVDTIPCETKAHIIEISQNFNEIIVRIYTSPSTDSL